MSLRGTPSHYSLSGYPAIATVKVTVLSGPAGVPVRAAIVRLAQRCGEEVLWLSGKVGADRIHRISGKPPDMAPVAYRIAWMLRTRRNSSAPPPCSPTRTPDGVAADQRVSDELGERRPAGPPRDVRKAGALQHADIIVIDSLDGMPSSFGEFS